MKTKRKPREHKWYLLTSDTAVTHICPDFLIDAVVKDLNANKMALDKAPELLKDGRAGIDLPGMALANRPRCIFRLNGLRLYIPCLDVGALYEDRLEEDKNFRQRTVGHHVFGKMHGWRCCVVLTPEMRANLLADMKARYPRAMKREDAFRKKWAEGVDARNAARKVAHATH